MDTSSAPKRLSPDDVERIRVENEALRATNARLRRALQILVERQRERRAQKQQAAALDDSSRCVTGNDPANGEKPRG
jgi:hypothetical protein